MKRLALPSVLLMALTAACAQPIENDGVAPVREGLGELKDASGETRGTVTLDRSNTGLVVNVSVKGLEPGGRAFHLHQTGSCDAPDFTSAGGHLNPFGKSHGELSPDGKHLGDLPNIEIDETGSASVSFELDGATDELLGQIFDADGSSAMLHAGPDDYKSDPAGAAGPRIACAVLTRTG